MPSLAGSVSEPTVTDPAENIPLKAKETNTLSFTVFMLLILDPSTVALNSTCSWYIPSKVYFTRHAKVFAPVVSTVMLAAFVDPDGSTLLVMAVGVLAFMYFRAILKLVVE